MLIGIHYYTMKLFSYCCPIPLSGEAGEDGEEEGDEDEDEEDAACIVNVCMYVCVYIYIYIYVYIYIYIYGVFYCTLTPSCPLQRQRKLHAHDVYIYI